MRLLLVTYFVSVIAAAIIGIDFGQQYSKAILLAPNINFEIVLTDTGKRKDLSAVSIRSVDQGSIERIYGSHTSGICNRFPQSCIQDSKSLLGKALNQVDKYLDSHFGIKLLADDSRNSIKFDLGLGNKSWEFSVEEIAAMNLAEIRDRALETLISHGDLPLLDDVAITVSPFASAETRQAYLDSLRLANFSNVLGLVDEGTAVALNFVSNKKLSKGDYNDEKQYHLVYDMGAGSTTATLFSFTPFSNGTSNLEIESIGFNENLGGETLTTSIYNLILEKFLKKFKIKPSKLSPKIATKLYESAERAKIILSANSEYKISLESIYDDEDFKTTITREEFEKINSKLIESFIEPILTAVNQVENITIDDIQSVILNGGSTRVPFIQKELNQLIGNDKISKSVNTDESCALGTTYRALQLKTTMATPNQINVIDRSSFNYDITINGEEQVVFPKRSIAGESVRFSLGQIDDKNSKPIKVELLENGRIFKTYELEDLVKKTEKLACKSKQGKQLFATFTLDQNKIFDLSNLEAECIDNDVDVEEEIIEEKNDTNTTSSKSKKISRPLAIAIPKASHALVKPITRRTHERLWDNLVYLKGKDEERLQLDNLKNNLEALCYELRGTIEDNGSSLLEIATQDELDQIVSEIRDTIEWLEFGSDGANYSEVKEKLDDLTTKKSDLTVLDEMKGKDLSYEAMEKLHSDGSTIFTKITSRIEELKSTIEEFRPQFEFEHFDFDKESDRVKTFIKSKLSGQDPIEKIQKGLVTYKVKLDDLEEILDQDIEDFNAIAKKDIFPHFKFISDAVVEMLADLITMETSHKEQVEMLDSKLKQLVKRKQQKENRKKLKQKKAEEEEAAAAANEENPVEANETEQTAEIPEQHAELVVEQEAPEAEATPEAEVDAESTPEADDIEHDEL